MANETENDSTRKNWRLLGCGLYVASIAVLIVGGHSLEWFAGMLYGAGFGIFIRQSGIKKQEPEDSHRG